METILEVGIALLYIIGIALLFIIGTYPAREAIKRKNKYKHVLNEMFLKRDLHATNIVATYCKLAVGVTNNEEVNNIVFGLNNGVLSVFGGGKYSKSGFAGHLPIILVFSEQKVAFRYQPYEKLRWKKLLKEDFEFFLTRCAWSLFPKNERNHFRHLFDVPVDCILEVSGKQMGKDVEIQIECTDRLIQLVPYCKNEAAKVAIANTIIDDFFRTVINDGVISQIKIAKINNSIPEIATKDVKMTTNRNLKRAAVFTGAVITGAVISAVALNRSVNRQWDRDHY
jgi:hypothetical protein